SATSSISVAPGTRRRCRPISSSSPTSNGPGSRSSTASAADRSTTTARWSSWHGGAAQTSEDASMNAARSCGRTADGCMSTVPWRRFEHVNASSAHQRLLLDVADLDRRILQAEQARTRPVQGDRINELAAVRREQLRVLTELSGARDDVRAELTRV